MMSMILLCIIFIIVGNWKMYTKMGQKGWYSLIPVYNQYILLKSIGLNPWWLLINCALPIFQPFLAIYLYILTSISIYKSFGTTKTFLILLMIFPWLFKPILGFTEFKYNGPKPMEDKVFKLIEKI